MRFSMVPFVLLIALLPWAHPATPAATPAPSPAATPAGCAALPAYVARIADVVAANGGLALIPGTPSSILALPDAVRDDVAARLTALLPELAAIDPPAPAEPWHRAYIRQVTWYRDLALARDSAAWQRLINNDRIIARDLATARFTGQATCGVTAWDTAFALPTATPTAPPSSRAKSKDLGATRLLRHPGHA